MTEPSISNAAKLLLSRMLVPSKTPPTEKALLKSLADVIGPTSAEAFDALKTELTAAGYAHRPEIVGKKKPKLGPFQITESGRAAALAFLGIERPPSKVTWSKLLAEYVFTATVRPEHRAAATDKKTAGGFLLADALHVGVTGDVKTVIERTVMADLGYADARSWDELVCRVMGKRLGVTLPTMKLAEIVKQLPRIVFDLADAKPDKVKVRHIRAWATEHRPAAPSDDLPAFARAVHNLTAISAIDRFGDNKVFISSLYDHWRGDRPGIEEFKRKLVDAHKANLLTLSRADLVGAMDAEAVRRSSTTYLNAEFHFVLIEPGSK